MSLSFRDCKVAPTLRPSHRAAPSWRHVPWGASQEGTPQEGTPQEGAPQEGLSCHPGDLEAKTRRRVGSFRFNSCFGIVILHR
jgi:hypothetical protein